jgi:hypothetical protein
LPLAAAVKRRSIVSVTVDEVGLDAFTLLVAR